MVEAQLEATGANSRPAEKGRVHTVKEMGVEKQAGVERRFFVFWVRRGCTTDMGNDFLGAPDSHCGQWQEAHWPIKYKLGFIGQYRISRRLEPDGLPDFLRSTGYLIHRRLWATGTVRRTTIDPMLSRGQLTTHSPLTNIFLLFLLCQKFHWKTPEYLGAALWALTWEFWGLA